MITIFLSYVVKNIINIIHMNMLNACLTKQIFMFYIYAVLFDTCYVIIDVNMRNVFASM